MDRNEFNEPWVAGVYETGRTKPPKRRGGCCAAVLIVFIFLFGLLSLLSVLGVRLFNQFQEMLAEPEQYALEVSEIPTEEATAPQVTLPQTQNEVDAPQMELSTSPAGLDNYPGADSLPLQDIYEENIPSVVSIATQTRTGSASGTGVVLTADGYIVTNAHVVEDAVSATVLLTDGRELEARLVGADTISDLAVLHVEASDLDPAEFGDSGVLRVGDSVAAIGDPLGVGLRGTLTNGIVSAINRDVSVSGRTMTLIQTNAAINSGNSGGPLINCYGQVVGINTMKIGDYMNANGVEGLGFAIPSSTVKGIVDQLISQGYVSGRPYLGISGEAVSTLYQYYYRLPQGLFIKEVVPGSDAELKGLESGDILISIDGHSVTSADELTALLYEYEVGDKLNAIIYRNRKQYPVELLVEEATG